MVRAALRREESRGSHFRIDFPKSDDKRWKVVQIIQNKDGKLSFSSHQFKT